MINAQSAKEEFWLKHVEDAGRFEGTIRRYCELNSIHVNSFYFWRKKLSRRPLGPPWPFAKVSVEERPRAVSRMRTLPDPRWAAEFVWHLMEGVSR